MNIIFSSGGNDSVALIQWATENLNDCIVAYSDTGWASDDWPYRMTEVEKFVIDSGFEFVVIQSEGFENLVRRKKGFPANGMAFCSYELKIKPAMGWLEKVDPDKRATCYTGVMRIESKERKDWPEIRHKNHYHNQTYLLVMERRNHHHDQPWL
jgi:3'-phosphoadenosine 5'-phosphosulfate sulfotransferase (PAPS reductase)/FAD synthetase